MPVIATAEDAKVNRRRGSAADGVTFWHTLYMGTTRYNMAPGTPDPEMGTLFPMAFLVEQDPGSTASAHYHQANQFQLVVDGHATMGTHEVRPVTVHFAGAHTAYGPIRASNDAGVHYFTLRNSFDPGARFMTMPENRAALRQVPARRHREVGGRSARVRVGRHPGSGAGRHGRVALPRGRRRTCHRPGSRLGPWPVPGSSSMAPCRRKAARSRRCPASSSIPKTRRSTPSPARTASMWSRCSFPGPDRCQSKYALTLST